MKKTSFYLFKSLLSVEFEQRELCISNIIIKTNVKFATSFHTLPDRIAVFCTLFAELPNHHANHSHSTVLVRIRSRDWAEKGRLVE